MGNTILAAVTGSILAVLMASLLLWLFTGEVNPAIVAGVGGAVGATSAVTASRKKPDNDESDPAFGGVFDSDEPAKAGD